jgi:glutathione synthase/RimK-type ligase-like ATP-grasp enzyme
MVYRCVYYDKSKVAERLMMSSDTASFRNNWASVVDARGCSYFIHKKVGLPVVPSVPFVPNTSEEIEKVVEQLGGFPMIVKVRGGSHGVGVIRVDSLGGLKSLLDYFRSGQVNILIRKYIPHDHYARLVVVGDRVVASHVAYVMDNEFRTNAGDDTQQRREAVVFSPEVQAIAVRAVQALGLETGGVDLLFDKHGQPFLTEVNFPHDFSITQHFTGINIAEAMVKHLMEKTQK